MVNERLEYRLSSCVICNSILLDDMRYYLLALLSMRRIFSVVQSPLVMTIRLRLVSRKSWLN